MARRLRRTVSILSLALLACAATTSVAGLYGRAVSGIITGSVHTYLTQPGDSLTTIAARFGVEVEALADDNALPPASRLRLKQVLRIDNRHIVPAALADGILINIPQRMLFVSVAGRFAAAYPVAIGAADWRTPTGSYEISSKEVDPSWEVPASIQREMAQGGRAIITFVPPGPANPLGDRWIGLRDSSVGIHGTNHPASIYRFTTHGCIRLHPDDARALFDLVEIGTPVRIIYETVLVAIDDTGRVWLEVHPDVYRRAGDALGRAIDLLDESGVAETIDPVAVRRCVSRRAGRACEL
jgi:L,D-transpeptidase ErfK/SrfK